MKFGTTCAARISKARKLKARVLKSNGRSSLPNDSLDGLSPPRRPVASRNTLSRLAMALCLVALLEAFTTAQDSSSPLLFEVSNPKHLTLPQDEANRIYSSACELVARSIRPEKPPRLAPKFVLVLGADADETLRSGPTSEIHLREWNSARFAEAMVLMATREILKGEDVVHLTRDTLMAAQASVSVNELRRQK
jgi:hypothetical protein